MSAPKRSEGKCVCDRVYVWLLAGLLESSMRLKPHEAQSYRKKALWVSGISIVVTLILAVAAFSKRFDTSSQSRDVYDMAKIVTLLEYCAVSVAS